MSNWISVKDRLPENLEVVLIYDSECKRVLIGTILETRNVFCTHVKGYRPTIDRITHWQPLPEPPTKE